MTTAKPLFNPIQSTQVQKTVDEYRNFFEEDKGGDLETRNRNYTTLVNHYYDLATDFYEKGWGRSFHFAPRHSWESFEGSLSRHEMYLALRMGLKKGMRVVDVGCGVGGPMMTISRFSGASIAGVNNNAYQIRRGTEYVEKAGLAKQCKFVKADFMHMPVPDATFDAAYTIEASCHAPNRVAIYAEILRTLKPGAYFAGYEWTMTDRYNPEDPNHQKIKKDIMIGNGLPDLLCSSDIPVCLKEAGFEVIEVSDLAETSTDTNPIRWYSPLEASYTSLSGFQFTPVGKMMVKGMLRGLEWLKVLPSGTLQTSQTLHVGASALVEGGRKGLFTPMLFLLARKPL